MTEPTSADPSPRPAVTMRQVAKAAGVSLMTVSLALRAHPKIPAATRLRVERAAKRLGYRPNPAISNFMNAVRTGTTVRIQSTLAVVMAVSTDPYNRLIFEGVRQRAEALGYSLYTITERELAGRPEHHTRIMQSRGIRGLVVLPLARPMDYSHLLDWSLFSAVSTTYSLLNPHIHRVVPHQFYNTRLALGALTHLGYQRIGMFLSGEGWDQRLNYSTSAAFALHVQQGGSEPLPILEVADERLTPARMSAWYTAHRPDVVITNAAKDIMPVLADLNLRSPRDIGLLHLGWDSYPGEFAGVRQHPQTIGAVAVDQLVGMIQRGETGVPTHARVTMIEGDLSLEPTLRSVRPRRKATRRAGKA